MPDYAPLSKKGQSKKQKGPLKVAAEFRHALLKLGRGSQLIPLGKQQVNARKPQIWQLSNIAAAGDGVIGIRLNDGDGVFACQIDDVDRDYDPERNG